MVYINIPLLHLIKVYIKSTAFTGCKHYNLRQLSITSYHRPFYLSVYLSAVHSLSVEVFVLSVCSPICCLSAIYKGMPAFVNNTSLFVYVSAFLYDYLSAGLFVCISVCLSVFLCICLLLFLLLSFPPSLSLSFPALKFLRQFWEIYIKTANTPVTTTCHSKTPKKPN